MRVKTDLEICGHFVIIVVEVFAARKLFGLYKYYS